MNPRILIRKGAIPILLAVAFLVFAPLSITLTSGAEVTELSVPPWVVQGETLSISGKAAPNEEVWIGSSFELSLPVSADGKYAREFTGINFPEGEKTFSVTAEGVENIRASISPVFWQTVEYPLDGPLNATDGTAKLSLSFPAELFGVEMDVYGEKDVKVYGDAADGATSVNLNTATSIKVIADPNGDFTLEVNTEGVPLGEFSITAGSEIVTVEVVVEEPTPTPSPTPSPDYGSGSVVVDTRPTPSPTTTPTPASTSTPAITSTPVPTTTPPQTAPIQNEPEKESPNTPRIPGFELVGGVAALLMVSVQKRFGGNQQLRRRDSKPP